MKLKPIIWLLLLSSLTTCLTAQEDKTTNSDVIYLKNGSVFKGEIVEYEQGKTLKISLSNGQVVTLQDNEIERIVQGGGEISPSLDRRNRPAIIKPDPPILKTEGWYNTAYISFASGRNRFDEFTLGAGVHNVTGKHFKPWLGVGLGIGIDNYSRRGETIMPIYTEIKGYPIAARKEFYFAAALGWGFAFKREEFGIEKAKGGYMFHPAIGYRAGTSDGTNVTIDLGVKIQDAFFKEQLFSGDVEERDILFKRLTIRVGLTLWGK